MSPAAAESPLCQDAAGRLYIACRVAHYFSRPNSQIAPGLVHSTVKDITRETEGETSSNLPFHYVGEETFAGGSPAKQGCLSAANAGSPYASSARLAISSISATWTCTVAIADAHSSQSRAFAQTPRRSRQRTKWRWPDSCRN